MFVLPEKLGRLTLDMLHERCQELIREIGEAIQMASRRQQITVSHVISAAQQRLIELFPKLFPDFGLLSNHVVSGTLQLQEGPVVMTATILSGIERDGLRIINGQFTAGVSVALAVKVGQHVIAAYVLDVLDQTLYYVAPGKDQAVKVIKTGVSVWIQPIQQALPPDESLLLVDGEIGRHPGLVEHHHRTTAARPWTAGYFVSKKSVDLSLLDVALGLPLAGKGEPGLRPIALALPPNLPLDPWLDPTLISFSRALNVRTLWIRADGSLKEFRQAPPAKQLQRPHGTLYLPGVYLNQLSDYLVN